ncbi:MAG: sensor domain-containing diguanylate cyclase [Clostridiales bacterium]
MSTISKLTCEKSIEFVNTFLKVYLEDRNFSLAISMFNHNISWFGTGKHEVCRNFNDVKALMDKKKQSWDGKYKLIEQWYKAAPISDEYCLVYGEFKATADQDKDGDLLCIPVLFSMICCIDSGEIKLYHSHLSVPNMGQNENEFLNKTFSCEPNKLAHKTFEKRNKLLENKNSELEMLANNIYGGLEICDWDEGFTILYANDGFSKLTGYSQSDISLLLQNKHTNLMLKEDIKYLSDEINRQIKINGNFVVEYRIKRKDGKIIWLLDKGMVLPNGDKMPRVQCVLTDITAQKEQEQFWEQGKKELETIANSIEGAIIRCYYDDYYTVDYANDGFFRMIGYTREQFKQECDGRLTDIIYPDDVDFMNENIKNQLSVGNHTSNINRLICRDGSIIWILAKGSFVTNNDGKYQFHGVFTDITEQKNIEEKLKISEKRYEIAIGFSDITMFEYDVETKELMLQEKDAKLYGVSEKIPDGVETLIKLGIIDPPYIYEYRKMYQDITAGAAFANCYVKANGIDGTQYEFEINLINIFGHNGKSIRVIGVKKNVTQLRALQKEKEYGTTMASKQLLIYEANVSRDEVIYYNEDWVQKCGDHDITSFSQLKQIIDYSLISDEEREYIAENLSKDAIIAAFERGQKLITLEYCRKIDDEEYHWYRENVMIIKDDISGDISIRCYIADINDEKIKEIKAKDEQSLYEAMISKAAIIYEINLTKNVIISNNGDWDKRFHIHQTADYSEMINALAEKVIHPDDAGNFKTIFARQHLLDAYKNGKAKVAYEYRRTEISGEFVWLKCTFHLFENLQTGDVKAHAYIENIDAEKKKELLLIYNAEHDLLTGLYNNAALRRKVRDFLITSKGKAGRHGFLIIDIDYFKSINDNFGHAFGDAVLSQVGVKIKNLFRESDILGRIGGDEFVAFMKNIDNDQVVMDKAKEICNCVQETFTENNTHHKISSSVGIALYSEHGKEYEDLYRNSDTALYVAKANGRNQCTIYNDNMGTMELGTNEINPGVFTRVKTFEDNALEYVFRILYESNDKVAAINSVLELIAKHYNVSRAYVFEDSADGKYTSNTFEWCSRDIAPQIDKLQNIAYEDINNYKDNFNEDGIYFMTDIYHVDPVYKNMLENQNIMSMLQFAIVKNDEFKGFIGFDECDMVHIPSKKEVGDLQNISNILSIFIMEMRAIDAANKMQKLSMSIINGLTSYAYICDPKTYKLLFINDKAMEMVPHAKVGEYCYKVFWNSDKPCNPCPMQILHKNAGTTFFAEKYNSNLDIWIKTAASWIDWIGDNKVCLINGFDVTNYKRE